MALVIIISTCMNVCVYYSCSQTLTSDDVPVTSEESVESPAERSEPPAKRVHLDPPESRLRLDIASYIALPSAEQTDDKKHQLIVHHFVPDATYKFPKAASGRSFQYKWLSRFPIARKQMVDIVLRVSSFHTVPAFVLMLEFLSKLH